MSVAAAVAGRLPAFAAMSDAIWERPELRWEEHAAMAAHVAAAAAEGFRVERAVAGLPTACMAEAGSGGPVIAFLGEYDALAGMGQAAGVAEPRPADGAGHGCGHHLLGTGALLAAVAARDALAEAGLPGTVRYYGCPAEEAAAGKTFMVREGAFAGVDAALAWHPSDRTWVMRLDTLAYFQARVRFRGVAGHAASAPHRARSALDAAELMNVGVNFLREHMPPDARVHYAFLDAGGTAPNVVPAAAELYYLVRDRTVAGARQLLDRVERIASGASLMTDADVAFALEGGSSELLANEALEAVMQEQLDALGPVPFDAADQARAAPFGADGLDAVLRPPAARRLDPSSTDVGDVSWAVPTATAEVACFALGTPAHSWQWVAQGKLPAAHKGMAHAAALLAATALALARSPERLDAARSEHARRLAERPYDPPLPPDLPAPPARGLR